MNNLKRLIEGLGVGYRILSGVALAVITATGGAIITVLFFNDFDKRTDAVDSWIWLVQFPFTVGAHPVYFPDFM